jgi:hypothetical protein
MMMVEGVEKKSGTSISEHTLTSWPGWLVSTDPVRRSSLRISLCFFSLLIPFGFRSFSLQYALSPLYQPEVARSVIRNRGLRSFRQRYSVNSNSPNVGLSFAAGKVERGREGQRGRGCR